jgi:hypothetical protein
MSALTIKAAILADPSTSYWLSNAIKALEKRDPLDAARDAALLAQLQEHLLKEAL